MSNLLLYPQRCDGQNMDTPASLECLSSVSMYISACVSFQTHQDVLRMPVVVCAGAVLTLERVALITRQQQQHDMTQGIYLAEWLSTHGSSIGRTFLQGTPPTTSLPERIDAIYIYSHTLTCMELRARVPFVHACKESASHCIHLLYGVVTRAMWDPRFDDPLEHTLVTRAKGVGSSCEYSLGDHLVTVLYLCTHIQVVSKS